MQNSRLLEQYNWQKTEITSLISRYKSGDLSTAGNIIKEPIFPPDNSIYYDVPKKDEEEYARLYAIGQKSIEAGELGIVILNGGMATRFGGVVKGIVEVFDGMSFLELKIRTALKVSRQISFFVMNSFATDDKTKKYFEEKEYFGCPEKINTFNQFIAPRINEAGDFFESDSESHSYYGPGHGDFPFAFQNSGLLDKFIKTGGKYIFFSNVDNLGARLDPVLLGMHINAKNQISAEEAAKFPGDEGGAPALVGGKIQLVEGFCFPEDFDQSTIPVFNCATYWVNAESLNMDFVLPWYVVKKKVNENTAIQFERLAGDLTKFLSTTYIRVDRSDRFLPIKKPADLESLRDALKELLDY